MTEATQSDAQATQMDADAPIEDRIEGLFSDEPEIQPAINEDEEEQISDDVPEIDAANEIELDAEQLAKMFDLGNEDISIGDDGDISFKTNIDGEQGSAKLSDLIKSYQLEGHVNKKSMELGEQKQKLDAYTQQVRQNLDVQLQQAGSLVGAAEQQLNNEYNSVDWQNLRISNPAEFAAMQQEFGARNQEIQQIKQNATVVYQQQQQQIQQQQAQASAQFEAQERQLLHTAIPEWADEKVAKQDKAEIVKYMQDNNWPIEMIQGVSQYHQAVIAVRSLAKQANANPDAKKIMKKPRAVLKSGSAKTKTAAEQKKTEAKRNRFKKTGSVDDLASALIDRI